MAQKQLYACCICKTFKRTSFRPVFRHMRQHRFDPNLTICCTLSTCTEVYTNLDSFRKHVYRKHRDILCPEDNSEEDITFDDDVVDDNELGCDEVLENSDRSCTPSLFSRRTSALFLLKTREERKVTQTALNGIVQDMRSYWEEGMERLQVY